MSFLAEIFIITKDYKKPKFPSLGDIHTIEYKAVTKKKEKSLYAEVYF